MLLLIGLSFRENVTTARYAMDDMTSSLAKGENIFYAVDAFCREIADGVE